MNEEWSQPWHALHRRLVHGSMPGSAWKGSAAKGEYGSRNPSWLERARVRALARPAQELMRLSASS